MKRLFSVVAIALTIGAASSCLAQPVAGTTVLGVEVTELQVVMAGWSAKKALLGKPVYNDKEKIGKVEDIIISPERQVSYVILGVGGFLNLGEHKVAIPASQIKMMGKKITLPGATSEQLKAMPKFEYAKTK